MHERIIFMGTPDFAVPALRALADRTPSDNLLVVTQPDRAAGRGRKLQAPPVKIAAGELGLQVVQVETLKHPEVRERLTSFEPALIVVAAFGRILPKWVLNLPPQGCVNLHASDLPRFRGASPIAAAIACGDSETAVSLMQMEAGLDTGDVYAKTRVAIADGDTTEQLTERLADAGSELLNMHLDALLAGTIGAEPQRGMVIETRKVLKQHGEIDWSRTADEIEHHVRAMWPWPRAWTVGHKEARVQVHDAEAADSTLDGDPGEVLGHDDRGVLVATGDRALRLRRVQLAGKSAQHAYQVSQHPVFAVGERFEPSADEPPPPWIVTIAEV